MLHVMSSTEDPSASVASTNGGLAMPELVTPDGVAESSAEESGPDIESPGKIIRQLTDEDVTRIHGSAQRYVANWKRYAAGFKPVG